MWFLAQSATKRSYAPYHQSRIITTIDRDLKEHATYFTDSNCKALQSFPLAKKMVVV